MPYNVSAHIHNDLIHRFCINSSGSSRLEDQTLDIIPGLTMMRISDLSDEILWGDSRESLFSSMLSKLGGVLPQASAAVMNFYHELYCSSQLTNDLNSKVPSLLNVGFLTQPLPPPPLPSSDSDETGCLQWLDRQKAKSVAYINFGTVAIPPEDELIALAEATRKSDVPFLWSLQGGDHRMNERMVEEVWGIGVKVEGMVLTKSGVLQSLELMFSHEEGKKMRENVLHLKEIVIEAAVPNGSAT